MDILKTPSTLSLLDSDLESVDSLHCLDIEELDDIEYALPTSEEPTLAEVLGADDEGKDELSTEEVEQEPYSCLALQAEILHNVSTQVKQAEERSSAGCATALDISEDEKIAVGTSHGHVLSFIKNALRWVCDTNVERGAVSCLTYNGDSTRLLVGYGRGLICQYESVRGIVLRRLTIGGETWGMLKLAWTGSSGLALDTGGSVWLLKFSRPLGVRSVKSTCLFSGARGEVVTMTARNHRMLGLATLTRVIIIAGGQAAGLKLTQPSQDLPVLTWNESDDSILLCARGHLLQWIAVHISNMRIMLRPIRRAELVTTPLWMGWLCGSLAIFDVEENFRLWGEEYDKPLNVSHIEPVYASAFFKGVWTDGRVSQAMSAVGSSALGGVCCSGGSALVLGRRGVLRVTARDPVSRARALLLAKKYSHAMRLLCMAKGKLATSVAVETLNMFKDRPHLLTKNLAEQMVKMCLAHSLSEEMWSCLWDIKLNKREFVSAVAEAIIEGRMSNALPSPDKTQALIEELSEFEPDEVERVLAALPLTSIDPHRASLLCKSKYLWSSLAVIATALGGVSGAFQELCSHVAVGCEARGECGGPCAGAVLRRTAAAAAGTQSPAQHAMRHQALQALLEPNAEGVSPLERLVRHGARGAVRLAAECARSPGPLARHNRARVARALLAAADKMPNDADGQLEIAEYVGEQMRCGALPADAELCDGVRRLAERSCGERADRAWLAHAARAPPHALEHLIAAAETSPRRLWTLHAQLNHTTDAVDEFFKIDNPSDKDVDELFAFVRPKLAGDEELKKILKRHLDSLIAMRPQLTAVMMKEHYSDLLSETIPSLKPENALEFAKCFFDCSEFSDVAATVYLSSLCQTHPEQVKDFLIQNKGLVRPEDALDTVRKWNIKTAEPLCLEATGDHEGALNALLELYDSSHENSKETIVREACELCKRVAVGAPKTTVTNMWRRILERVVDPSPAITLEAVEYLPIDMLLLNACRSPAVVISILKCAASRYMQWACLMRVAGREAHACVALGVRAARRGLGVRGPCVACGRPFTSGSAVRTTHCGRASHVECPSSPTCSVCARRVPAPELVLPPPARLPDPASSIHTQELQPLILLAPPRPDFEGVV